MRASSGVQTWVLHDSLLPGCVNDAFCVPCLLFGLCFAGLLAWFYKNRKKCREWCDCCDCCDCFGASERFTARRRIACLAQRIASTRRLD